MGQETVDELRPNVNHIVPGVFSIEILVYTLRHRRTGPRAARARRRRARGYRTIDSYVGPTGREITATGPTAGRARGAVPRD